MISLLPELPFRTSPGKSKNQLGPDRFSATVRASIKATFGAGADGVILSCEYAGMRLANLGTAGDELRQIFAREKA